MRMKKTTPRLCPVSLGVIALLTLLAAAPPRTLAQTFTLQVDKSGDGRGVVVSDVAGINCGPGCEEYPSSTVVKLTAYPASDSTFMSFSGDCYGYGLSTCTVTVDANKRVTAWFYSKTAVLTVTLAGDGTGRVTSSPPGIGCGFACSYPFPKGEVVRLTATPDPGTTFGGWMGGWAGPTCSGMWPCTVTMDRAHTATALFYKTTPSLTVIKTGTGTGTVVDDLGGINCGADCSEPYPNGTVVTLSAKPDLGVDYLWIGPCQPGRRECIATMDGMRFVFAVFYPSNKLLTVKVRGSGVVSSKPAGIDDCRTDCAASYPTGAPVELSATPDPGFTFTGWGGDCGFTPTTAPCRLTVDRARTAFAFFAPATATLTVARAGDGSGRVTRSPAGIDCGTDCWEYPYGTPVDLTAEADIGSTFTGWTGIDCPGTGKCLVPMNTDRAITATFTRMKFPLLVGRAGSGSGSVTSDPPGIDCGTDCGEDYLYGTRVSLSASPESGSVFAGWGGACTGTGTCTLTIDRASSVSAIFLPPGQLLSVLKTGDGSGTVRSIPAGIDCGADCSETYASGTSVSLSTAADAGSTFTGWSGGGCGGTGSCVLTMDSARTVTASFARPLLSVAKQGMGSGRVTSSPGGIDCGGDCFESYAAGTVVRLSASADGGSTFGGWSGACGGTGDCIVTMDGPQSVTAFFNQPIYTLSVSKGGNGSGTVDSASGRIFCGPDCSDIYLTGETETLSASPDAGSIFTGWSGACSGTGTCTVTMNSSQGVTANFGQRQSFTLSVSKAGPAAASGHVTSNPAGIDCGGDCSQSFTSGTVVTLTAVRLIGVTFAGWDGDCTGDASTCTLTMNGPRSVTATFTFGPR